MKKALRKKIGIRKLKREGLNYLEIAEKIRKFKVNPEDIEFRPPIILIEPTKEHSNELKLTIWQKIKIWFRKFIHSIFAKQEEKK